MLAWMGIDLWSTGRVSLTGTMNGLISGLVAITPAAGYVNGYGALVVGLLAGIVPYYTLHRLDRVAWFRNIDDTLGVFHTHFVAGAVGGLLTGLLADPAMTVYLGTGHTSSVSVAGLFYGDAARFGAQALALAVIVGYDAMMTLGILRAIALVVPLGLSDNEHDLGDIALHGERVQAVETDAWVVRHQVEALLQSYGLSPHAHGGVAARLTSEGVESALGGGLAERPVEPSDVRSSSP